MAWETHLDPQQQQLSIIGELTIFSVQDIRTRLLEALAGQDALTIDLAGVSELDSAGLQLMLQYSLPVFMQPAEGIAARNGLTQLNQVAFQYRNSQLAVTNNAKSHIRISELSYINPNGEKIPLINGLVGYALAGQSMRWDVPQLKQMLPNGKFEARINSDGLAQTLPMQ